MPVSTLGNRLLPEKPESRTKVSTNDTSHRMASSRDFSTPRLPTA